MRQTACVPTARVEGVLSPAHPAECGSLARFGETRYLRSMGWRRASGRQPLRFALVLLTACRSQSDSLPQPSAQASASAPSPTLALPLHTSTPSPNPSSSPLPSASREPQVMKGTLHSLADCQNGGLRACLAPFVKATLTSKDIVGLRKWLHIRTSNCPGGKPTIYGEWPCEPANLPMLGIVRGPLPKDVQRATTARVYTPSDCAMRPRGSASR